MEPIDTELFGTVHRPSKINSKVKGNSNELAVTKILSEWTNHEFVRVPMSGGLRWKNRMDICGDIINTDPSFHFPFSVETKHLKTLNFPANCLFELRKNSAVYTYFTQCKRDAAASGKYPFLMVRSNGMKKDTWFIGLSLTMSQLLLMGNYVNRRYSGEDIDLYHSEEFFKSVSYETLKWIYGNKD